MKLKKSMAILLLLFIVVSPVYPVVGMETPIAPVEAEVIVEQPQMVMPFNVVGEIVDRKLSLSKSGMEETVEEDLGGIHTELYDLSEEEFDLLCRCAQSEAGYKNFQSQIYVVNVIMNRVNSEHFPNSVTEVINEHRGDLYQFSVVKNGMIETEAVEETINNVREALIQNKLDLPSEIIYFHATGTRPNCTPYIECEGTTFGY